MPITPPPAPLPRRQQPEATFVTNAENLMDWFPTFASDANALETNVNAKEATASAAATTATTKAGEALASANAAALSETAAAGSASSAAGSASSAADGAASVLNMDKRYLGAKASEPSTDNQGQPLQPGAVYYDTTLEKVRTWTGTVFVEGISAVAGVSSINGETGDVVLKVGGPKLFYFSNL